MFGFKKNKAPLSMTSSEKDREIKRLELERAGINAEIEDVLRNYAKESGFYKLGRKKRKNAPNNYSHYTK